VCVRARACARASVASTLSFNRASVQLSKFLNVPASTFLGLYWSKKPFIFQVCASYQGEHLRMHKKLVHSIRTFSQTPFTPGCRQATESKSWN